MWAQEKNWPAQEEGVWLSSVVGPCYRPWLWPARASSPGGVSQRGPGAQGTAPALVTSDSARPSIPYGVASGDVTSDAAIIWSRTNKSRPHAGGICHYRLFTNARRVQGPAALAVSDFTARVELTDLPAGQEIFYRVLSQDLADPKILSAPTLGHFRTAPAQRATSPLSGAGIPQARVGHQS